MKQKNDSSKNATKGDLELLARSLRKELLQLEERIESLDENARKYRDEILTKLDSVMGELKTMREETTIGAHQVFELREQVDNHEERISHLEESKLPV